EKKPPREVGEMLEDLPGARIGRRRVRAGRQLVAWIRMAMGAKQVGLHDWPPRHAFGRRPCELRERTCESREGEDPPEQRLARAREPANAAKQSNAEGARHDGRIGGVTESLGEYAEGLADGHQHAIVGNAAGPLAPEVEVTPHFEAAAACQER